MKKISAYVPLITAVLFAASEFFLYEVFAVHQNTLYILLTLLLMGVLMMLCCAFIPVKRERTPLKSLGLCAAFGFGWLLAGVVLPLAILCAGLHLQAKTVCPAVTAVSGLVFFILAGITLKKKNAKAKTAILCMILCAVSGLTPVARYILLPVIIKNTAGAAAIPKNISTYRQEDEILVKNADFYVSPLGNDEFEGTFAHPFATLKRAKQAVRELDKTNKKSVTVALMAGEYPMEQITFTKNDSGTKACPVTYCRYGDGEVILNGGITISAEDFYDVSDPAIVSRLSTSAKRDIICTDLKKFGLTEKDWGKLFTAVSSDAVKKVFPRIYYNDICLTLARYPNETELTENELTAIPPETALDKNTASLKKGTDYRLDTLLNSRVASWQKPDQAWLYGFFDQSDKGTFSPVHHYDPETGVLTAKFVNTCDPTPSPKCWFFNILEELDRKGEWFLDTEKGLLYILPPENTRNASVDISLLSNCLLYVKGAEYLTFSGLTLKGTTADAVTVFGDHITVKNCVIKNVGENGVTVFGSGNLISENKIFNTGSSGIVLDGGNREKLTPADNRADNNLIYYGSQATGFYRAAVILNGVGNICSHNEICHYPLQAITYSGNNHIMEYNHIHNVCEKAYTEGAISSGEHWDYYGNQIRYNLIADIGSEQGKARGISLFSALSGQTVYGNFLVNINGIGIELDGGRDLTVKNNVLINCGDTPLCYTAGARDGILRRNALLSYAVQKDGKLWQSLHDSPYRSKVWQKAYPAMARFSEDSNNRDDPSFVPNPSYSEVTDNLIVNIRGTLGNIHKDVHCFSTVENNAVYSILSLRKIFTDPEKGDYSFRSESDLAENYPKIKELPFKEIGRY